VEEQTKPKRILKRWESLKSERSSWMAHWKEISDHLAPRSGRFFVEDRNKGDKRHNKIYDSTGTKAHGTLTAGMMSGNTSPARPWFRLATSVPELDESAAVKSWVADITRDMQRVFAKSNTYRALHTMYHELGAYGTACAIVLPDFDNVIHLYPLTAGEYCIATDHRGVVNTLYREFQMTIGQLVEQFGETKCSNTVQQAFKRNELDKWVTVLHAIEPRKARDASKSDNQNMPWSSCYVEKGSNEGTMLRESGFKRFPAICPRWEVTGGDVYGSSPAMTALGDIKQLQHEQLMKARAINHKVNPALQLPSALKNMPINTLPGGASYVDQNTPNGGIRTAFQVDLDLSHLLADINDVRNRINGAFYADVFLMMANGTNSAMTATEVAERHEEKMLMLGPVIERFGNEGLEPLINMTFDYMLEAGIVPVAPQEMEGMDLSVEFVSMLAQAQRAIATNSVDRFVANVMNLAQVKPEILDRLDADYYADDYADMVGVDPRMVVPLEKANEMRQARAQAAQQAAQQEQMSQAADTASKLGGINTSQPSALGDVTRAFSGYT
jgi:hypothetical protein